MPTRLNDFKDKLHLPLVVELSKGTVLSALQGQVESPIDPESLAYDTEGFVWDDGDIVLDVTFKDRRGILGQGRVTMQPGTTEDLDVCFMADIKFVKYLASPGAS